MSPGWWLEVMPPSDLQLDALREVANIGCGHAANALSQLVGGRKVEIDVPKVELTRSQDLAEMLGGPEVKVIAAVLEVTGELDGHLLLVLPEADAHKLSGLLLNRTDTGKMDELERSALSEAANIVASACLSAMGDLSGLKLLPSPPRLVQDAAGLIVDEAVQRADCGAGLVMLLQARFFTQDQPTLGGQLLVLPTRESLGGLLKKLGV
jgi:chemotaxis protein CheC